MTDPGPGPIGPSEITGALNSPEKAPEIAQPGDGGPERRQYERPPFPRGCPIKPLGVQQDISGMQRCFYLNWNGQLASLEAGNRHGKNNLIALFGPSSSWLEDEFPQWSKPLYEGRGKERVCVRDSEIIGFSQADASRALIEECVRQGPFNPSGRMRGIGAHELRVGRGLVLHCGDTLVVSDLALDGSIRGWKFLDPGLLESMVYVADEAASRPWTEAVHPAVPQRLLKLLMSWKWRRPLLDARFVLGAIGLSPFGGALPWRPHVWITGDKSTGKSTLNGKGKLIHQILGEGVFRTGNASAAAIRQHLRNSTMPVMFDEIEAKANNDRVGEVIELARVASSGDTISRGASDHTARDFTLQSCFWFSSVLMPPLEPTDRSRLAILELDKFDKGAIAPDLASFHLPDMGRMLMRRMLDNWERLAVTKAKYHAALAKVGHDNRGCDQFASLLAGADVLLHDWDTKDGLPDDEEIAHWAGMCRPERMAEVSETVPDHQACLNHLITSLVQARGGDEREALGTWIGRAVNIVSDSSNIDLDAAERAHRRLQELGLRIVNASPNAPVFEAGEMIKPLRWGAEKFAAGVPGYVAVAQSHQALAKLFEKTTWQGSVWYQSLKRVPGALEGVTLKFGRTALRGVLLPLWAVLDDDELPPASKREAAEAWRAEQESGGHEKGGDA